MSAQPEVGIRAAASPLTDPLVLLLAGLLAELVAVVVAVLPGRPLPPVAPLGLVIAGLLLATFGAVGLARDDTE